METNRIVHMYCKAKREYMAIKIRSRNKMIKIHQEGAALWITSFERSIPLTKPPAINSNFIVQSDIDEVM